MMMQHCLYLAQQRCQLRVLGIPLGGGLPGSVPVYGPRGSTALSAGILRSQPGSAATAGAWTMPERPLWLGRVCSLPLGLKGYHEPCPLDRAQEDALVGSRWDPRRENLVPTWGEKPVVCRRGRADCLLPDLAPVHGFGAADLERDLLMLMKQILRVTHTVYTYSPAAAAAGASGLSPAQPCGWQPAWWQPQP